MGLDVTISIQSEGGIDYFANPDHDLIRADIAACLYDYDDVPGIREIPGGVETHWIERYYEPGYERGNWPKIYGCIRAIQRLFPGAIIRYGSDSDHWRDRPIVTDEFLESVWEHYMGPDGHAYRRR